MKRIISFYMAVIIVLFAFPFSTNAYNWNVKMGDVTGDFNVDIFDATEIQLVLAQLKETNEEFRYVGDVDRDNGLSVFDVTEIQLWLANLTENQYINTIINRDIEIHDFYQDYDSDMAMVGVPVTFTVNAVSQAKITSYELYIDGELVSVSEASNSIEYIFTKPGRYNVQMVVNTPLRSETVDYIGEYLTYGVVEPYECDKPIIKAVYMTGQYLRTVAYSHLGMIVYAEAIGGVAPYEYKFVLTRPITLKNISDTITIEQDYSTKNYFELECIDYEDVRINDYSGAMGPLRCELNIFVKDANGVEVSKMQEVVYSDYPIG